MYKYLNGNTSVCLYEDGTRVLDFEQTMTLDFPLNIDIRVSTACSLGQRPDGSWVFCNFCHEEAKTDGSECVYDELKEVLEGLPRGMELAIGANSITVGFIDFLVWAREKGFVCNITINQLHTRKYLKELLYCIKEKLIYGLGISFRHFESFGNVPKELIDYKNTVIHVISGIDSVFEVEALTRFGVKKILVLGEKDFGANAGRVNLESNNHKEWFYRLIGLFSIFDIVSFDNLAVQQLKVDRFFFDDASWQETFQGEFSMYIDAVRGTFSRSSRDSLRVGWHSKTLSEFFLEYVLED